MGEAQSGSPATSTEEPPRQPGPACVGLHAEKRPPRRGEARLRRSGLACILTAA